VVVHFGEPFFPHVLEGGRRRDGEADEEDVGLGIRERPEAVVILLPSGVEEAERVWLVANPVEREVRSCREEACFAVFMRRWSSRIDAQEIARRDIPAPLPTTTARQRQGDNSHHRHRIIIKDRRHVFRREFVGGVADEEARLAHSTVTDDHAPAIAMRQPSSLSLLSLFSLSASVSPVSEQQPAPPGGAHAE
jgi:hypothetical protein